MYLDHLGNSLMTRFEYLGTLVDIENAIAQQEEAVSLTPNGHPDKPSRLNSLGKSFYYRFKRLGNIMDINNAVVQKQRAVDLTPNNHPRKPMYLSDLGKSLQLRFERLGNIVDNDNAITQQQAALGLIPDDHPTKPAYLAALGNSLRTRFELHGNISDIDDAISKQRNALNLTPDDHPDKPMYLNNLGSCLETRFQRFEDIVDINNAIKEQRKSLGLVPDRHPEKPIYLSSLGASLLTRFKHRGDLEDIDGAIQCQQKAVEFTPDRHPRKPIHFSNLGSALQIRFERTGDLKDNNNAIAQQQAAANLTPDGHPDKPNRLNRLGISLRVRFERLGDLSDIENAILQQQMAVDYTSDNHPKKTDYLCSLGESHWNRYLRLHCPHDAEAAICYESFAARSPVGAPSKRLEAAERWISFASSICHPSLLAAYETTLTIIPLVAWLGFSIADRHRRLLRTGTIAREAAATAIALERYDKAIEWLEQSRSVVWAQILRLRTPADELRDIDPNLADRLLHVSQLLDRGLGHFSDSIEEEGPRYRALTTEWESLVEKVRSLPKFEDFLRPLRMNRLINAAQNGPVVVINIASQRCDALALIPECKDIIHIPLPNITHQSVMELQDGSKKMLNSDGIRMRGDRAAKAIFHADEESYQEILAELWNGIVKPVIDSLAFSVRVLQNFLFNMSDYLWYSVIQISFPVSGGVPLDHSQPSQSMRLVYMTQNQGKIN
jgi:tetratricopeptide (TPR) repeat protein